MNLGGLLGRAVQGSFTILRTKCTRVLGQCSSERRFCLPIPRILGFMNLPQVVPASSNDWGKEHEDKRSLRKIELPISRSHSAKGNWIHNDVLTVCLKTSLKTFTNPQPEQRPNTPDFRDNSDDISSSSIGWGRPWLHPGLKSSNCAMSMLGRQ